MSFLPDNPPTSADLRNNLYAVHATNFLPSDAVIRPITRDVSPAEMQSTYGQASFRPGLHFSLGSLVASHGDHSWESVPYAVVAPLGTLEPNLANIYAHDTFTVGNLALDEAGVTLFVPEGENTSHLPGTVDVQRYPANTKIRAAIDKHISDRGGWRVDMNHGDVSLGSPAYIEGQQINDPAFFNALLAERPDIGFGVHTYSMVGEAFRYGTIDQCINKAVESYKSGGHNPVSVEFDTEIALHNLAVLEAKVHAGPLPVDAQKVFDAKAREVRDWSNVIHADLALAEHGKTIAYTKPHIQDSIWGLRNDPAKLTAFIEDHWNELRSPRPSEQPELYITALKMACLPLQEVNQFFADRPKLASYIQGPAFNVLYAVARLGVAGNGAREEGLESLLEANTQLLDKADIRAAQKMGTDVVKVLSQYLVRNSALLDNALDVINQPAIRRLLNIKNADEPVRDFDDLLDRHPKTAGYKTDGQTLSERDQTLFDIMVGLHWVRADGTAGNTTSADSFSKAEYRKSIEDAKIKNFKANEIALTSPIRDGDPTGYDAVPIGGSLSEMQLLCRDYAQDASELWKDFGLAAEYRMLFPNDALFWSSDRSIYDIHQDLVAAKTAKG